MSVAVKKKSESCADTSSKHQARPADDEFGFAPMRLSRADWDVFMEAMENPPEPNAALRAAWAKYQSSKG